MAKQEQTPISGPVPSTNTDMVSEVATAPTRSPKLISKLRWFMRWRALLYQRRLFATATVSRGRVNPDCRSRSVYNDLCAMSYHEPSQPYKRRTSSCTQDCLGRRGLST